MEGHKPLMECILANSPRGYPKMCSEHYVEDVAGWNQLFSKHICFNPVSEVFEWNGEGTPVIIEDCEYLYLYFKKPDGTFEPVGCSWTYEGDGKIKNKAPGVRLAYRFSEVITTDVKKSYIPDPILRQESVDALHVKADKDSMVTIPEPTHPERYMADYDGGFPSVNLHRVNAFFKGATVSRLTLKDFYGYICSGDRPSGGDYYLGFLNDEEWKLQIYTGRYQVNFCKRAADTSFHLKAAMLFDPNYSEVRFAKVDEFCRADYGNMTLYSMDTPIDDVDWTCAFGIDTGISIINIINILLKSK